MTDNLIFTRPEPGIGELVLSQPLRRNALNAAMWAALPQRLADIAAYGDVKTLIVRGDGDHFASGADISEFETLYATPDSAKTISDSINTAMTALAEFPKPTIAMIRGACVGGGCGLALCCDIRFADNTAKFAITPAKLGLVYPFADVRRLIEAVGIPNAKDILMSARLISVKAAARMGLINRRFKVDQLEDEVLNYARGLVGLSGQSLDITKAMIAAYQGGQKEDTQQTEDWFMNGFSSDDFKEGYQAFLAKRKPEFK